MHDVGVGGLVYDRALQVEGVVGGEDARAALAGWREEPVDVVERPFLRVDVVDHARGLDVFNALSGLKAHDALGLKHACSLVVDGLVGGDDHGALADFDGALGAADAAGALLRRRADLDVSVGLRPWDGQQRRS